MNYDRPHCMLFTEKWFRLILASLIIQQTVKEEAGPRPRM
jgi:hypothetical protein